MLVYVYQVSYQCEADHTGTGSGGIVIRDVDYKNFPYMQVR
jgi:hypothetical protein